MNPHGGGPKTWFIFETTCQTEFHFWDLPHEGSLLKIPLERIFLECFIFKAMPMKVSFLKQPWSLHWDGFKVRNSKQILSRGTFHNEPSWAVIPTVKFFWQVVSKMKPPGRWFEN